MPFELTIVTPQGRAFQGTVERVVLPGSEGEFGVLASHERFLSPLRVGEVEILSTDGSLYAAVGDGFAEVSGDEVSVLVDSCELQHEIDVDRADAARARAEQALEGATGGDDLERDENLERALARAHTRLSVSQKKS